MQARCLRSQGTGMLYSHFLTFPPSHFPTFPLSHFLTFSLSHFPTFPLSHFPTFPLSHFPTFPLSHFLTFSLSHFPTFSLSHFLTFSPSLCPLCLCGESLSPLFFLEDLRGSGIANSSNTGVTLPDTIPCQYFQELRSFTPSCRITHLYFHVKRPR